jgi:hypothetical protein
VIGPGRRAHKPAHTSFPRIRPPRPGRGRSWSSGAAWLAAGGEIGFS